MKLLSADEAVARIPDGATVAVHGTGPVLEPDLLLAALGRRFLAEGHPRDLTLFTPMCPGSGRGEGGMNHFAHPGMLRRVIGASFSKARHPRLLDLIRQGAFECYMIGMGAAVQMLTAAGTGKPGVFTQVGLGTCFDPRREGGAMNERSRNPPVRYEVRDGREYLYYPTVPIDVAIIRGTTADENGYISFEEETNTLAGPELALAAHNSGGIVIAQVKRLARANSLDPRFVRIPGPLVDFVTVHPRQTQLSPTMADPTAGWNPFFAGALKHPLTELAPMPTGAEQIILRRAALELRSGDVINLGAGAATKLPLVALQERINERVVFTNEHGVFGGMMGTALGGSFVPALNADAIMDSAFQFNFYEGGGLDITFLGVGQVDAKGDLNVSRFGEEINGPGGFNTITDRTPRIVFCGTLTTGGLKVRIEDGRVAIASEGQFSKYVPQVEQVTFNAARALQKGQQVLYVTERCVFVLGPDGPVLTEVAPGIEIDHDIRPHVGFDLVLAAQVKTMDERIFAPGPMGLWRSFGGGGDAAND